MFLPTDVTCIIYNNLETKDKIALSLSCHEYQENYKEWLRLNWDINKQVSISHFKYLFKQFGLINPRSWLLANIKALRNIPVALHFLDYLPYILKDKTTPTNNIFSYLEPTIPSLPPISPQPDDLAVFLESCAQVTIPSLKEISYNREVTSFCSDTHITNDEQFYYLYSDRKKDWLANKEIYQERLVAATQGILSRVSWDQVALIGGINNILLDSNLDIEEFPASDVDLFVWGQDKEERRLKSIKVLSEIYKAQPTKTLVYSRGSVITILVRDIARIFQVICTQETNLMDIFINFDSSMSCIGYDGNNLVCHPHYLKGVIENRCIFHRKNVKLDRIIKMLDRGINVSLGVKSNVMGDRIYTTAELKYLNHGEISRLVHNDRSLNHSLNKYLFISNESISRIDFLVHSIWGKNYHRLINFDDYKGGNDWVLEYNPQRGILPSEHQPEIHFDKIVPTAVGPFQFNAITNKSDKNSSSILLSQVTVLSVWRAGQNDRLVLEIEVTSELLNWLKLFKHKVDRIIAQDKPNRLKTLKKKAIEDRMFWYCGYNSHTSKGCKECSTGFPDLQCNPGHYILRIRSGYSEKFPKICYKNTKLSSAEEVLSMFEFGYKRKATLVVIPQIIDQSILSWRLVSMQLYHAFC